MGARAAHRRMPDTVTESGRFLGGGTAALRVTGFEALRAACKESEAWDRDSGGTERGRPILRMTEMSVAPHSAVLASRKAFREMWGFMRPIGKGDILAELEE